MHKENRSVLIVLSALSAQENLIAERDFFKVV